ncbi:MULTISPECIES: hypothetical protein [Halomicrobium]|uniref:hypothetical protein n=1 Tax=Halomicrobium TaxID=203135 RepID=UPI0013DEC222|nr:MULTISPECIES: hypothetical protein [Halomicrobium]
MTPNRPPGDGDRLRDLLLADAREDGRQSLGRPIEVAVRERGHGVVGNVVQDLSYGVLDPRIDDSGR